MISSLFPIPSVSFYQGLLQPTRNLGFGKPRELQMCRGAVTQGDTEPGLDLQLPGGRATSCRCGTFPSFPQLELLAQELSAHTRVSHGQGQEGFWPRCPHKEHPQLMAVRSCPCLLLVSQAVNWKCQEYFWIADPGRAGLLFHVPVFLPSLLQFSPEGYF